MLHHSSFITPLSFLLLLRTPCCSSCPSAFFNFCSFKLLVAYHSFSYPRSLSYCLTLTCAFAFFLSLTCFSPLSLSSSLSPQHPFPPFSSSFLLFLSINPCIVLYLTLPTLDWPRSRILTCLLSSAAWYSRGTPSQRVSINIPELRSPPSPNPFLRYFKNTEKRKNTHISSPIS